MQSKKIPMDPTKITADEWLLLLVHDTKTYTKTKQSISQIIKKIGEHHIANIPKKEQHQLYRTCLQLIPIAANQYLHNLSQRRGSKFYKFSTYFSWWAIEVYSTYDPNTKKIMSKDLQNPQEHIKR
ncbi:hypothetical protein KBC54_00370 [Patescibacteria group bacterium]|nr:hypothetical protein [Patescibacteria group bacterium]